MKKAIIICGSTASGKSELALQHALKHKGAIINIDSSQLYQNIPIITASPTSQDKKLVPHYLYNHLSLTQPYSLGQYLRDVKPVIDDVDKAGLLPIIVGGTGMYIKGLLDGIYALPTIDPACKLQTELLFNQLGKEAFYQLLIECDSQAKELIKPSDSQRMQHAFSVFKQTGKSILYFYQQPPVQILPEFRFTLYYLQLPRELLYQRCNQRVESFIHAGVLEEIRALLPIWATLTNSVKSTIGINIFKQYLEDQLSYTEAIQLVQQHTRRYAKRQVTWFRNQFTKHQMITINDLQSLL